MQQAELRQLFATHGRENIRAIVENFNWDADSYMKLESAYKEAEKRHRCDIIEPRVRHKLLYYNNIFKVLYLEL